MTWPQASFRGVPFEVEDHEKEGGPRFVIHEFPGRDEAYAEPNGQHTRRFPMTLHVVGDAYRSQLRALEDALDQKIPGKLVHPEYGTLLVVPDGPYRVRQNTRELGKASITVTFAEAATQPPPFVAVETSSAVTSVAARTLGKMQAQGLDVSGPDFLAEAATAILAGPQGLVAKLSKVNNRITAAFGLVDTASQTIIDFGNEVGALIRTPGTLALTLQNLVNSVFVAIGAAGVDLNRGDKQRDRSRVSSTLGALSALGTMGDGFPPVVGDAASREKERQNQAVLIDLIEATGTVEAIKALAEIPLDNSEQADDMFGQVSEVVDRLLNRGTLLDDASQGLRDLLAQFLQHLRRRTVDLTGLGRFTPQVTMPAILIAYELYGDPSRATEIVERNVSIEHPGFCQGGVTLAVADV